jgi:hypothetical protein
MISRKNKFKVSKQEGTQVETFGYRGNQPTVTQRGTTETKETIRLWVITDDSFSVLSFFSKHPSNSNISNNINDIICVLAYFILRSLWRNHVPTSLDSASVDMFLLYCR